MHKCPPGVGLADFDCRHLSSYENTRERSQVAVGSGCIKLLGLPDVQMYLAAPNRVQLPHSWLQAAAARKHACCLAELRNPLEEGH